METIGRVQARDRILYVLIDETLEPVYGAVQGGHAVAQWLIDNEGKKFCWRNNTLVYLKCNILKYKTYFDMKKISYSYWREPDLDNRISAIALEYSGSKLKGLKPL